MSEVCENRPHVHYTARTFIVPPGTARVVLDNSPSLPVALCPSETVAKRIAVLIDRYGLADVPDTPAGVAPGMAAPWPPPAHPSFGPRKDTP